MRTSSSVVTADIHWQSETRFADLILPACSGFEREDICEMGAPGGYGSYDTGANFRVIIYMKKCIEPLWESKSDYDIYCRALQAVGLPRPVHRRQYDGGLDPQGIR